MQLDLVCKACLCLLDGVLLTHGKGLFPGIPGGTLVLCLERHKERIVRQPEGVFLLIGTVAPQRLFLETAECLAQDDDIRAVQQLVVDTIRAALPELGCILLVLQKPLLLQHRKINKVWVSCIDREALVRGIAVAGGGERQDLPVCRLAHVQKVYKVIRCPAHSADAVTGGKAGYVQQNTAFSHDVSPPLNSDSG